MSKLSKLFIHVYETAFVFIISVEYVGLATRHTYHQNSKNLYERTEAFVLRLAGSAVFAISLASLAVRFPKQATLSRHCNFTQVRLRSAMSKINTKRNIFNALWENSFLFGQNAQPICMVCGYNAKRNHKHSIERHYNSCSKKNCITISQKNKIISDFKLKFSRLPQLVEIETTVSEKISYTVALALAKHYKPFDDGIFFKDLSLEVLECFGVLAKDISDVLKITPLSRQTIMRRTEKIGNYLSLATKQRILNCQFYSISLDESVDINNICQLVICVKYVDELLQTYEEILSVVSLHGHVKGETIYQAVKANVLDIFGVNKLSSICTDGAKVMVGRDKGLVGCLLKNGYTIPTFHCIIHQQALFSKVLEMNYVMEVVVKLINKIRGGHNALNHRKFKEFLEEYESIYGDLLMYTQVRWLSRGKCLQRFFDLRCEVLLFMEINYPDDKDLYSALQNEDFILDLAFLTDITKILNDLNLTLQGKNKHIFNLITTIDHFDRKLKILIKNLTNQNLSNLPITEKLFSSNNSPNKQKDFIKIIEMLSESYHQRFLDFQKLEAVVELHNYPLICEMDKLNSEVQQELKDLREDFDLSLESGENFWKSVSDEKYMNLKKEIYKLYSMFGSTYNCEVTFSTMKNILSKNRNLLSDSHLSDLLRIKNYSGELNIEDIIKFHKEVKQ